MLNHTFEFMDNKDKSIRISDKFMQKMKLDLLKYKFTWNGYDEPRYGLNNGGWTFINPDQIAQLKSCLLKQSENEKEYTKLMDFIELALKENKEIHHIDGAGSMVHPFIICEKMPADLKNIPASLIIKKIHIHDQFILDYYEVFSEAPLYWDFLSADKNGFNYYGNTIISPEAAQKLIDAMDKYLKDNHSEEAEYFLGEDHDLLREMLTKAILENMYIIHFGLDMYTG